MNVRYALTYFQPVIQALYGMMYDLKGMLCGMLWKRLRQFKMGNKQLMDGSLISSGPGRSKIARTDHHRYQLVL